MVVAFLPFAPPLVWCLDMAMVLEVGAVVVLSARRIP